MLRLAESRDEVAVVADQHGSPTSALDIADGVIAVCRNLLERPHARELRGVFHLTGAGAATWAEFAELVFATSAELGGPAARVRRIRTDEYPTPARRPANSRLEGTKLQAVHGLTLPDWQDSVRACVARLLAERAAPTSSTNP